jgi:pimeloyl-ACP methyl ester carboxylesterase
MDFSDNNGRVIFLHYRRFGCGEPLIILHGLFGSHRNWLPVSKQLSMDFSVYTLDLRNHGDSPHSDVFGYEVMAEDLKTFMVGNGIEKAIVLGHSLGGQVAMSFAVAYPEKVSKLIVVETAPGTLNGEDHKAIIEALIELDLHKYERHSQILQALEPAIPSVDLRHFLIMNIARDANRRFYWKINLNSIWAGYDALRSGLYLKRPFPGPTLFIRGDRSNHISSSDRAAIRKHFPQAELKTVGGAGHWVHSDAPETFLRYVIDFCKINSHGWSPLILHALYAWILLTAWELLQKKQFANFLSGGFHA